MRSGEKPTSHPVAERASLLDTPRFVVDMVTRNAVILKFITIGALGYVIYQFVVAVLYDTPLFWFMPEKGQALNLIFFEHGDARLLIATLVATELSISGVFTGHRLWTFRHRDSAVKPLWIRFGQFNAKALVSTLGILTVTVNVLTVNFDISHYMAIPVGVLLAFTWNWTWDTQIVWRRAKRPQAAP